MSLKETAHLASQDATLLEEMAARLRAVDWQIAACGNAAHIERQKAEELAPKVIKAMANYI